MEINQIKYNEQGLLPVVTQDYKNREVLMVAYMNPEALKLTLHTGKVHYWSRKRKVIWLKGETSGHFQTVKDIIFDCDKDTLLILVEQSGNACHTGNYSCFFNRLDPIANAPEINPTIQTTDTILNELYNIIIDRTKNPTEGSYTNYLFDKGLDKMLKKIGEEASEVIIASKNRNPSEVCYEVADLLYHLLVVLVEQNITLDEIYAELKQRHKSADKHEK